MNILTNDLPDFVTVDGVNYTIRSDFKTWLKFHELISDRKITADKLTDILILIYIKEIPRTIQDAISAALRFYSCYEEKETKTNNSKPIMDFAQDSGSIYAAFRQQYNINLTTAKLHWFEFRALLDNLTDSTKLVKIMEYRGMNISKIKDKETKKFYRDMKRIYKLEDTRTDEEKEQELAEAFFG